MFLSKVNDGRFPSDLHLARICIGKAEISDLLISDLYRLER
ncbi:hypothetical protein OB236_13970 [Paenibacillus sp. WQ 127069]|uniref:Uncharacterized protein n=1 Tax=Paenibacillus baimaensis TaxID=2982185 RepID=A0ABT2UHU0_9BACL|nr:hypothetical protein [Paenibacillus sp. WQ 127069]